MNSRERLLAAIRGEKPDRIPILCRPLGLRPPEEYRSSPDHPSWYSSAHEHTHVFPQSWSLEDDLSQALRWLELGADAVIEVSPPWGIDPQVTIENQSTGGISRAVYQTPMGELEHTVRIESEAPSPGAPVQPRPPLLFSDWNATHSEKPAVTDAEDSYKLMALLRPPDENQKREYGRRMESVKAFAREHGVLTTGWSLVGMDGLVSLCGYEQARQIEEEATDVFAEQLRILADFDRMRTEYMLEVGGVDLVIQRGFYSGSRHWNREIFEFYVAFSLKNNVEMVHQAGALFAYVLPSGAREILPLLADCGVDLLLWADPLGGDPPADLRSAAGNRMALAGGVSLRTLARNDREVIRRQVKASIEELGPDRFILEPAGFCGPDVPWTAIETLIEAARGYGRTG